jgi:hypothetical protein
MSWAARFATGRRNGARDEWSRRRPGSERVQGRKYLLSVPSSKRSNRHDGAVVAALLRDAV